MPELPEVETVRRGISKLNGKVITNIIIRNYKLRYPINPDLSKILTNQQVKAINRRAKYLVFQLESGYLIMHLGMSGRVTLLEQNMAVTKHDHLDLIFDNYILRLNDPRRFGCVLYTTIIDNHPLFEHLGPEPLHSEFNAKYLLEKLKNRNSTIKQLVMDNQIVVGVGNIYACESLFLAKISPLRKGSNITLKEAKLLTQAIKDVLTKAIELGGSTLRDYKQSDGSLGYFQNVHNVYGKSGSLCKVCQSVILEHRLGQRNSFYCPNCQK